MRQQRRGGASTTASLTTLLAHRKAREAVGVLLTAVALLTLVSLASYDPADPSFLHSGIPGGPIRNGAGWLGAYLAGALFGLAGAVALLVPAGLLWLGVRAFVTPRPVRFPLLPGTGATLGILSLTLLLALLQQEASWRGLKGEPLGGILGGELLRFLQPVLGRLGLALAAATALALAAILCSRLSLLALPLTLADAAGRALQQARALLHSARAALAARRDRRAATRAIAPPASAPVAPPPAQAVLTEGPPLAPPRGPEPAEPTAPLPVPRDPEAPQENLPFGVSEARYGPPPLSLLDPPAPAAAGPTAEEHQRNAEILVKTLRDFGVETRVADVSPGPVITRYEVEPGPGIKINRIVGLADDLALALKAMSVRVVAPIPGKAVVGVEIPNQNRARVSLREILGTAEFAALASPLPLALGKDIAGNPVVADLAQMPHLLIAGATGSGKSVCLNGLILSILFSTPPTDVQFLLIDPKRVELSIFNGIPHLLDRVVVEAREAAKKLQLVIAEMERRYRVFAEVGARNLGAYNQWAVAAPPPEGPEGEEAAGPLPHLVVVVDELADLMLVAAHEVENAVARLAQMARAVGIHLIVATQRPSVDVITGVIKANFPARLSFQVSSKVDSRTILDVNGAEQLLGSGDMLFLPPASSKPIRIHGCFVSEMEIRRVVKFLSRFEHPGTPPLPPAPAGVEREGASAADDPLYEQAKELVIQTHQASISMLQRRLRVGFNRAARLLDQMERDGIVSPMDGPRPREVLVKPAEP
ncbi:MAG TPA: DNA translocase FtsK 4TM domain-containing protein [Candidatus Methylomirabilis sp.]|nr:DNA translocase FtsK 4TM domain-containing protein [Candidatus Methylomirabilis sp.]